MNHRHLINTLKHLVEAASADIYTDALEYAPRVRRVQALLDKARDQLLDIKVCGLKKIPVESIAGISLPYDDYEAFESFIQSVYANLYAPDILIGDIPSNEFAPFELTHMAMEFERAVAHALAQRNASETATLADIQTVSVAHLLQSIDDLCLHYDVWTDAPEYQVAVEAARSASELAMRTADAYLAAHHVSMYGQGRLMSLSEIAKLDDKAHRLIGESLNAYVRSYGLGGFEADLDRFVAALKAASGNARKDRDPAGCAP